MKSGLDVVEGDKERRDAIRYFSQCCAGARLLLVEDDATNRLVAETLLGGTGIVVDIAHDGREAVRMATGTDYDLVLMDLLMPVMDGFEACRAMRRLPGWETRPIVAMTASTFEEDRRTCKEAGMNDFIVKPVSLSLFYETLRKWLPTTGSVDAWSRSMPDEVIPGAPDGLAGEILGCLLAVPGFSPTKAIPMLRGNIANYLSLLAQFAESHEQDIDGLDLLMTARDYESARRVAHSLRGAAAVMGIDGVRRAAEHIESALRVPADGLPMQAVLSCDINAIRAQFSVLKGALEKAVATLLRQYP